MSQSIHKLKKILNGWNTSWNVITTGECFINIIFTVYRFFAITKFLNNYTYYRVMFVLIPYCGNTIFWSWGTNKIISSAQPKFMCGTGK